MVTYLMPALLVLPTAASRSPALSNCRPFTAWPVLGCGRPVMTGCGASKAGPDSTDTWPQYVDGCVTAPPPSAYSQSWLTYSRTAPGGS
jgi:hypothetical protein